MQLNRSASPSPAQPDRGKGRIRHPRGRFDATVATEQLSEVTVSETEVRGTAAPGVRGSARYSVTKGAAATVAWLLAQRGELDFDAPVSGPFVPVLEPDEPSRPPGN